MCDPGNAGPVQSEVLTIGAAHSLRVPFQEILPMFESEYGATVKVVYGPSQTLRRQIEQGGVRIDVFLADAVEEIEKLQNKGLLLNEKPRVYAQTSLVLVMSTMSSASSVLFRDALPNRATRIAVVDPETSAVGAITDRALLKLDPAYKTRSNLFQAQHTEDLMKLVHAGKADVGLVYRSDAINSAHMRIVDETPVGMHAPVQFGHAVVWTCRQEALPVAEAFVDFMMSPRIQKLLLKYGFETPSYGTETLIRSAALRQP